MIKTHTVVFDNAPNITNVQITVTDRQWQWRKENVRNTAPFNFFYQTREPHKDASVCLVLVCV